VTKIEWARDEAVAQFINKFSEKKINNNNYYYP
jgi:hypothetical protein